MGDSQATFNNTRDPEIERTVSESTFHEKWKGAKLKWKRTKQGLPKIDISPMTVLSIKKAIILVTTILLVIVVLQIPTILFYNNRPSLPTTYDIGIDFETCTVSFIEVYSMEDTTI